MKTVRWRISAVAAGVLVPCSTALAGVVAEAGATTTGPESVYRTGSLAFAAAIAIALSVLGAGYAVGRIGSAAMGAAAEKPELLTRSIVFVALAEGLGVLGFAIAMMLVQKI